MEHTAVDSRAHVRVRDIPAIVERIERLHEQRDEIAEEIAGVYAEARERGIDATALRALIGRRRQQPTLPIGGVSTIPPERSSVYFIGATTLGLIKIGSSSNFKRRLPALRAGSPDRLEVARVIPGGAAEELALHNRFSHLRRHGEWFAAADDLQAFIAEISP